MAEIPVVVDCKACGGKMMAIRVWIHTFPTRDAATNYLKDGKAGKAGVLRIEACNACRAIRWCEE